MRQDDVEARAGQIECAGVANPVLDAIEQSLCCCQPPGFLDQPRTEVDAHHLAAKLESPLHGAHFDAGAAAQGQHPPRRPQWELV
ncbi:MAG: hypothetical protein K0S78_732 [Thermomicrobiales bacterium]|nr:hypothetical protein [Thermomicrobiales bacterium]